jgi:hypothetical protein
MLWHNNSTAIKTLALCFVSIPVITFCYSPVAGVMGATTNTTGTALLNLGKYNESIAYFDNALAIEPANTYALSGKKLDLAGLSKTNIVATPLIPHTSTGTPAIPPQSVFGYYFAKTRTTNATATPPTSSHKLR